MPADTEPIVEEALDVDDAPDPDEANRLRRIEAATPPAGTLDGQLQRWRDAGREARELDLEVVDNGTIRRQGGGVAVSSGHIGSSLAPGSGFLVNS
jgi:hypothetical protein